MESKNENQLLINQYFPREWDDLILPVNTLKKLESVRGTRGYRLLLFSSPGTGKTTTSRLLTKGHDTLYLSGSNDYNITTHREKVVAFASGHSVSGKQKTVVIDEAENIKDALQDAFKIIFDSAKSTNFIFITNEVEKINTALKSRFSTIDYDFTGSELEEQKKKYTNFFIKVCDENNIRFDNKGAKLIIENHFPDIRHMLVMLQDFLDYGYDVTVENFKKLNDSGKQNIELYNLVENCVKISPKEFFETLVKFKGKERECLMSLGEPYFEYLNSKGMYDKTIDACEIVSKCSYEYTFTINKFASFYACCVALSTLFR
jgi:replication-associated recombination protein RarA